MSYLIFISYFYVSYQQVSRKIREFYIVIHSQLRRHANPFFLVT